VVVTCGTCRDALEHLGAPGIFAAPLADVSAFARGRGLAVPGGGSALYHAPCHDSLGGGAQRLLGECGIATTAVPHCCSEAGTLALSRPAIAGAMRERKREALAAAGHAPGTPILTNCPSCLQGLHRNAAATGTVPRHLAVELAQRAGGPGWRDQLDGLFPRIEVVSF
jgi:Fe-S oxidoreductase